LDLLAVFDGFLKTKPYLPSVEKDGGSVSGPLYLPIHPTLSLNLLTETILQGHSFSQVGKDTGEGRKV
jgi:hypothetical protein